MDALVFMRELKRMCSYYSYDGHCKAECPMEQIGFCSLGHKARFEEVMKQAVVDVEKWSAEHPIEIDWLKVPRGTKVMVADGYNEPDEWQEEYFCAYLPFGEPQFTTFDSEPKYATDISFWKYYKLADDIDPTPYMKEVK